MQKLKHFNLIENLNLNEFRTKNNKINMEINKNNNKHHINN